MNPFEQMELKKMSLTQKELEVYNVFTQNVDDILRDTATVLAEKYHISQPAITRFCQKLGYHGFIDFKYDIYKYHKSGGNAKDITSVLDYYTRLIHLIPGAVPSETFDGLAQAIVKARYVFVLGFHKSSLPAQLLDYNLSKFGIMASAVPFGSNDSLINRVCKQDLVIIFSAVGPTYKEIMDIINEMPEDRHPTTVLVTQSDKHPIRNKVDQVIWLPSYRNQGYPQYLEAQVVPMIFVDLLTNYITNYTKEENNT